MTPFPKPTWEQFKELPEEEQRALFEKLVSLMDLLEIVPALQARIEALEAKLAKNSGNSSKPPSTDDPAKQTKSLREKSSKKPGGQFGRQGATLKQIENPDEIVNHAAPSRCLACAASLDGNASHVERRQVFDLPAPRVHVVEHRCEAKSCSSCGRMNVGAPDGVAAPVQYGPNVRALSAYLHAHQLIPFDRLAQLFSDVFNLPLSPATIERGVRIAASNVEAEREAIKQALIKAALAHFDETGLRLQGKLAWLHSASNDRYAYYEAHARRGLKATDHIGIFRAFRGVAVHDAWAPYWSNYRCLHALCNAHHLRELRFIFEQKKRPGQER